MDRARTLLADLIDCIGFFTRLPAARRREPGRDFASSLWAAPLAGFFVALAGILVVAVGVALRLPPMVTALLAVAATMAVTGALHEDGLSDMVDGFFGGYTRERRLEIMRDSRIGAFGAAALVFSVGLRAAALSSVLLFGEAFLALVAAHMASRALLPAMLLWTPPAREDGLAASVGRVPREAALAALAIGALSLLPLGILPAIAVAAALAALFLALRGLAVSRIGGHTGDVLGALQQLAEIVILCAAASAFA